MKEIIANHAHIFQKHVREDGSIDALKAVMDECGISRAVAFAPFANYYDDEGMSGNAWLAAQIKNDNRFRGFGTIDFDKGSLKEQVREIKELGFKGIKMHPAYQKFKINGEQAFEVYAEAEKLSLVISFHTGVHWHRISDYNMLLFDEVAYNFKSLKFSMEHLGGYSFFDEGIAVMINNMENTYAGLTSVFDRIDNKFWYLSDERVMDLFWLTGTKRSIFGLDFPYNGVQKITQAIEKIKSFDITDEDKDNILGKNLLEFINE